MLRTELKRAFCSKAFWATCGITLVLLAVGGSEYIGYALDDRCLIKTTWWEVYLHSLLGPLCILYPIIALLPYGLAYRRERDSGCRQLILLKTSRKAYLGAKILAVSGSAFMSMLLPNLCWLLVCRYALGETDPVYGNYRHMIYYALPLYDNHPGWYMLIYVLHASVLGAVFAVLGLGLSAVLKNRYLPFILPFCYGVFSGSVLHEIDSGFAAFYLLEIQLCKFSRLGIWVIPLYVAVLLALGLGMLLGGDYHAGKA